MTMNSNATKTNISDVIKLLIIENNLITCFSLAHATPSCKR